MYDILKTDKYKFTMAEAGYPLRKETFYYTHRRGGPHFLPFDVKEEVNKIFKDWNSIFNSNDFELAYEWMAENSIGVSNGFKKAFLDLSKLEINYLPRGSWFFDNEPVFTITGPSAIVSWLEPTIIRFNYKIQLATLALTNIEEFNKEIQTAISEEQIKIIYDTIHQLNEIGYKILEPIKPKIISYQYRDEIREKAESIVNAVNDPKRIFEVGMRAAACDENHWHALEACMDAGIVASSSVYNAWNIDIKAVGTMGHEHVQRFGSDKEAFRAMADRIPGPIFCLLDTFDTIKSGIKHAYDLIEEQPEREHAVRFDSGNTESLFKQAYSQSIERKISPIFCFEDGWNLEKTIKFERIRESLNISPSRFLYGFGGFLVNSKFISLTRDRVGAVWKLSKSGDRNTRKFSEIPNKRSIPGNPILLRPKIITAKNREETIVSQVGEEIPNGFVNAFENPAILQRPANKKQIVYSRETLIIIDRLRKEKEIILS